MKKSKKQRIEDLENNVFNCKQIISDLQRRIDALDSYLGVAFSPRMFNTIETEDVYKKVCEKCKHIPFQYDANTIPSYIVAHCLCKCHRKGKKKK